MKINELTNINECCSNISAILLNFTEYPQTETLSLTINELKKIIIIMRRYFALRGINHLINEFIITISASIERLIILTIEDIELLLEVTDLIYITCDTEYDNLDKLNIITEVISKYYIDKLKNINKDIALLKKTAYIRFDVLNVPFVEKAYSEKENIHVFKSELKSQIEKIDTIIEKIDSSTSQTGDIDDVASTLSLNQYSNSNFEMKKIGQLLGIIEDITSKAVNNSMKLNDEQINLISECNQMLIAFSDAKSDDLLVNSDKLISKINDYIGKFQNFAASSQNKHRNINEGFKKNKQINKKITHQDLDYLISNTINLNELLNYNNILNELLSIISQDNNYLITLIEKEKHVKNDLIDNILINLNKNKDIVSQIENIFNNKLLHTNFLTIKLYNKLNEIRNKPFSTFVIGLPDYVNAISDTYSQKVELKIENSNLSVNSDLWSIFEYIIPIALRHLITSNLEEKSKNQKSKIKITYNQNLGLSELVFTDNVKRNNVKKQINTLKDIIVFAQNAGGKIFITSNEKAGTVVKFRFQNENVLINYLILEVENKYYAIPSNICEFIYDKDIKTPTNQYNSIHINKIVKQITDNVSSASILIRFNNNEFILECDKIIANANLVPQRLTGVLSKIPYALGAAQYRDLSVLLLDIEEIMKLLPSDIK